MPSRQRMPFPGGMPGRNRQAQGMFPGQMMGFPQMGGMPQGMPQGPQKREGGFLSKILGKGNTREATAQGSNRAAGAGAGGSLLKSLGNPSTINGFLNNTQQVIKTAQTIGPMVQQYGPIVKNLPAMWKLYRGLKGGAADTEASTSDAKTDTETHVAETEMETATKSIIPIETDVKAGPKKNGTESNRGDSKPKMYI